MTGTSHTPAALLRELRRLRTCYDAATSHRKRALLGQALRSMPYSPAALRGLHELLLFLAAYPDDPATHALAERGLRDIAALMEKGTKSALGRLRRALDDSGIAGTRLHCGFSRDLCDWLAGRFGDAVSIDFESLDEAKLDALLGLLAARSEQDGLLEATLSTREWLERACGPQPPLRWLTQRLAQLGLPEDAADALFDAPDVRVVWRLSGPASRTCGRLPAGGGDVFTQRGTPLVRHVDVAEIVRKPLTPQRPVGRHAAEGLIAAARLALAVRGRETDPVTYADEREVTRVRLERGLEVVLFGMRPERRLPIESYFGYLLARNGVPLGYGGGWVLFDRCEIGVHIFDTFRGGESALAFAQVLRVYHQHYRVRQFVVDPFQFGAGNEEGLQSGAFWFYDRLGFRHADPTLRAIAARERERIRQDRRYRSPAAVLRRLSRGTLLYTVPGCGPVRPVPDLPRLGLHVSGHVAKRYDGDRERAVREAGRRWRRRLGLTASCRRWPQAEREAFDALSLLLESLDYRPGDRAERRRLAAVLRAKGGPRERRYVLALRRCTSLHQAMLEAAGPQRYGQA